MQISNLKAKPNIWESRVEKSVEAECLNNAKKTFISKWAKKTKAFGNWDSLGSFAYIGKKLGQEPFQELDVLMSCIWEWGSLKIQSDFGRSVHTWIKSKDKIQIIETPDHLQTVEGSDTLPFQRLWKAYQRAQIAKCAEDMAVVRRRALVELSAAYQEVIDHIRNSLYDGLRLGKGETAVARARKILYTKLYPDMQNQKKMTSRFNYEIRLAAPYYQLRQHYNNDGILAMVPSRFFEGTIQLAPSIPVMIQILDILRPDLREGTRLSFFSKLISMIFEDAVPDPGTLTELDKWTSVDNISIRWLPDIDPALAAVGDAEFPVNGLYRSETERAMLFDLPKDDRVEIMTTFMGRVSNRL